jgi:hypothetical protein
MTISEKLALQSDNELTIYKEGVFWIAYEQDAYRLSQVRSLKPSRKYIKAAGQDVVSVGFPSSILEDILSRFTVVERDEFRIRASVGAVDAGEYRKWKDSVELYVPRREKELPDIRGTDPTDGLPEMVYQRLRAFKLSMSTPMDCMRFIEELQKEFC